jgi:hypothetical protein
MAAQVSAAKSIGSVVVHGGTTYAVDVATVTGTAINYSLTPAGGGTALTLSTPYTAQPCNMLTGADGLAMGWGVFAAWIGAWGLLFLTRALRGEGESNYGNS